MRKEIKMTNREIIRSLVVLILIFLPFIGAVILGVRTIILLIEIQQLTYGEILITSCGITLETSGADAAVLASIGVLAICIVVILFYAIILSVE